MPEGGFLASGERGSLPASEDDRCSPAVFKLSLDLSVAFCSGLPTEISKPTY